MWTSSRYHAPLLALVSGLIACTVARSHHFKGLPHFSYFENYPQVPQDEFLGQHGEYEFSLVIYDFQGMKRSDMEQPEDVRLFLVIYNLRQNKVYGGPLTMEIVDRGKVVCRERRMSSEQESVYTMQRKLPDSGKYVLRLTLDTPGNPVVGIPFILSSQRIAWGKWISVTLIVLVGVVAIGSRRARVAMDRRENVRTKRQAGSLS